MAEAPAGTLRKVAAVTAFFVQPAGTVSWVAAWLTLCVEALVNVVFTDRVPPPSAVAGAETLVKRGPEFLVTWKAPDSGRAREESPTCTVYLPVASSHACASVLQYDASCALISKVTRLLWCGLRSTFWNPLSWRAGSPVEDGSVR